jgi:DNA-binding transcriptional regulator LsrR (DeoR family)
VWHFYYQKGLTQEQVAQKLGIASRTVIDIFKKHGWKPRPLRKADEEEGRRLREQGLTQKQIAEKLGVSQSAVQQLLRKQGLGFSRKRVEIDSKELRQLYHEKRLTQKQIAEKLGV